MRRGSRSVAGDPAGHNPGLQGCPGYGRYAPQAPPARRWNCGLVEASNLRCASALQGWSRRSRPDCTHHLRAGGSCRYRPRTEQRPTPRECRELSAEQRSSGWWPSARRWSRSGIWATPVGRECYRAVHQVAARFPSRSPLGQRNSALVRSACRRTVGPPGDRSPSCQGVCPPCEAPQPNSCVRRPDRQWSGD